MSVSFLSFDSSLGEYTPGQSAKPASRLWNIQSQDCSLTSRTRRAGACKGWSVSTAVACSEDSACRRISLRTMLQPKILSRDGPRNAVASQTRLRVVATNSKSARVTAANKLTRPPNRFAGQATSMFRANRSCVSRERVVVGEPAVHCNRRRSIKP
jgi:hypothetical protein